MPNVETPRDKVVHIAAFANANSIYNDTPPLERIQAAVESYDPTVWERFEAVELLHLWQTHIYSKNDFHERLPYYISALFGPYLKSNYFTLQKKAPKELTLLRILTIISHRLKRKT